MEGGVDFKKQGKSTEEKVKGDYRNWNADEIGEVRQCRFKMEGKRRQKGERLIITKKRVESTSKGRVSFQKKG